MNKIIRRAVAILPAIAAQLLWLFVLLRWLAPYAAVINVMLSLFAILFVLYIISNRNEGTYKTLWLLVILGLPVFGTILYLFFGNRRTIRPIRKKLERGRSMLPEEEKSGAALESLRGEDLRSAQTFGYVERKTGFSTDFCRGAEYFPIGEELWKSMLAELEKAERFIFAEYFIIENGKMWNSMVDIMAKKVALGVDVRVMYDDMGSISTFSSENLKQLRDKGIKCVRFNPLVFIKGALNYRDHRKMLIIDGKTAFSGGVNLADEYINEIEKHGHWKDIGFRLTGEPAHSYTRMFAEFWNAFSEDPIPAEELAAPAAEAEEPPRGYVLSYYDSPVREDAVSNNLFVELLSQSKERAWFYTPYLMLGDNLLDAFVRAAQRGIDVRIIVPGIPDKALVYRMSRSYYRPLLEAGVRIFEYTPGFVHAKACLTDGIIGTVGTVNLDYRSLFLHFENNSLFYRAPLLEKLEADFAATQEKCAERTLENIGSGFFKWLVDGVLRIFAPLC